jgi:hypothetical protein
MQIIFEQNLVNELREKYIVLELDTVIHKGMESPVTLYALIEDITFTVLTNLPDLISQHQTMIHQYKNNEYDDAIFNANELLGQWNGDLDEFYNLVISTCENYRESKEFWDGVRHTNPTD